MKRKIIEPLISFLSLCLMAAGVAAAFFLGILLTPLALLTIFIMAVKALVTRKREEKHLPRRKEADTEQESGKIKHMPPFGDQRKVA